MDSIYQEGTYQLKLTCSNCSHAGHYSIAKGTSYNNVRCTNCGCKDLHKGMEFTL